MRDYQFIETLKSFFFVEKIILFGSRARGDYLEKSDIDLAILCPTATDRDWWVIQDCVENADTLLKIDCVRLETLPADSALKKNILSEGIVLYEKNDE